MKQYWLITTCYVKDNIPHTFAIDGHPADWLLKYGRTIGVDGCEQYGMKRNLLLALPISKEQHDEMANHGYG